MQKKYDKKLPSEWLLERKCISDLGQKVVASLNS